MIQPARITTLSPSGDSYKPRSTPAAASLGGDVYLFGGAYDDFNGQTVTAYNTLHAYDTTNNTITELHPEGELPAPRAFAGGAADTTNSDVYVFGGSDFNHDFSHVTAFGDLYRYTPADNRWTLAADPASGPGARIRPNVWFHDGAIFVFGGLDGAMKNHSDLWRYDISQQRWTQVAGEDATVGGRYEAVSTNTAHNGRAFVVGGETLTADFRAVLTPGTVEIDLNAGAVTQLVIPAEHDLFMGMRHMAAAAFIDNTMYMYGGDDPAIKRKGCGSPHGENPSGNLWTFDADSTTWHETSSVGPALKRTVASAVGNKMFVFGGWDFECDNGVGRGQLWNHEVVVIDAT